MKTLNTTLHVLSFMAIHSIVTKPQSIRNYGSQIGCVKNGYFAVSLHTASLQQELWSNDN